MKAAQFERRDPTAVADAVSLLDSLNGPTVLVGSTASARPEPAFDAGVDVLAGARVADPDAVPEHGLGGDCGTDLPDHGHEGLRRRHGRSPGIAAPVGATGRRHRQTAPDQSEDTP